MGKIGDWIAEFKAAEKNSGNMTAQPEKKAEFKTTTQSATTEASTELSRENGIENSTHGNFQLLDNSIWKGCNRDDNDSQ